ncbi:hypothetical protein RF11_07266 [Thelohanellus kitauei]|uniref:CYRIA/CYRIB Rac1 binding domain-containing protein n=1 Tax=Thelohanellus kitauei TaxID=669202 RepID=A0A0C2IWG0_THEKT|nr:hypothetical protein RF11_07266 [Thelohanellus kitauei]
MRPKCRKFTLILKVSKTLPGVNPQEAETELYKECVKIMNESQTIMESLESYGQGATEAISRAYKNSGDAGIQEETWNTLQPLIEKLKNLRGFNEKISIYLIHSAHIVPKIATELCKSKDLVKTITENPGITEKFSHLLDSCIRLDGIKVIYLLLELNTRNSK